MIDYRRSNVAWGNAPRLRLRGEMRRFTPPATAVAGRCKVVGFVTVILLLLSGCSRDIDTVYGQRKGIGASTSVNGTAVLGEMFEQAGHHVSSWYLLSPRLQRKADCIVWFPDDFQPPRKEVCQWLESWLTDKPDRTLIYVGRDFDAEPWYWEHVLPDAPPEQQEFVRKRLSAARRDLAIVRQHDDKSKECDWFTIDASQPMRKVQSLEGAPEWHDGIDPKRVEISLRSRLVPPKDAKTLLKSGDDALVSQQMRKTGRLIVVANGSFLLNLPLVNHEHRKLAGKLIDAIPSPGKNVVFLESGYQGPPIREKDPAAGCPPVGRFPHLADQLDPPALGHRGGHLLFLALADLRPTKRVSIRKRLGFWPPRRRLGQPVETLPRSQLRHVEDTQLPTKNGAG